MDNSPDPAVPVPFRFEDLPVNYEGKRIEPEKWGPKYSKPPKPHPAKPRGLDPWPSNCASGQKGDFSAAKHRAKLVAEFHAVAAADKRAWATGSAIEKAYAAAMAAKRARLAREALPQRYPIVKPHYVLREGKLRLAA